MKIIERPTNDVIPYARNPRKNQAAVSGVAASIKEFGFRQPIVIDADGVVVAGHTRLLAARQLGLETVPCVVASDLTPQQIKAYRLLDNKLAEKAEWDTELLALELGELPEFEFEPFEVEWDLPTDATPLAEGSGGAVEPPVTPFSRRGDLWSLGAHRLLCGDSTDAADVERLMDGRRPVLMNTDPPYGVDYAAVKDGIPRRGYCDMLARGGSIANDDLTSAELQRLLEDMLNKALPHLADGCAFYLWHPPLALQVPFVAAAAAADILIHRQIVWVKPHLVLTRSGMYHWRHETCLYGWRRGFQPPWYGEKNQTSIWECGEPQQGRVHPTQKPLELFAIPMRNHTRENEIVYEPFSGSGSQLIAAERLGRVCYGLELEPRYVDVICQRFFAETGIIPEREDGTQFPVADVTPQNGAKEKTTGGNT